MNDILNSIQAEFDKKPTSIDSELMQLLSSAKLDLSQNIPDPQMLVSKSDLPICTRGNFSFVIGLPGARKSFLCTGIAGAFINENGCMGLDNPNGTGNVLWIDTEQAPGHVGRVGRRLHRIAGLPTDINSSSINIYLLREFQPDTRRKVFLAAVELHHPDFIVLDGVSDLIKDPNNSEQATSVITELMRVTKEYDCHILTVIHANVGSEKARGHLGSEALRKCETAILVEADGDCSVCKWAKTRDMRPSDFAFTVQNGLPIEVEYKSKESRADKLQQDIIAAMPPLPDAIVFKDLTARIMGVSGIKYDASVKRIKKAVEKGYIIKNEAGMYHLPKNPDIQENLPF